MSDIVIRKQGQAGRVTLNRPDALNALTAAMAVALEAALDGWRDDPAVALVVMDAAGSRAFCAGGDIADLYVQGRAGNFDFGRAFWWQEYRLNLKIATYPKPIVVFMHGFVMGGGVGIASHASHRIVGETSKVAMPECAIGLLPDVGGSHLLGRAPGAVGAYLGLTGARMGPCDAIYAGFADHYVPETAWEGLKLRLTADADVAALFDLAQDAPQGTLAQNAALIDSFFSRLCLADIATALASSDTSFAAQAAKGMSKGAPLAMACALVAIRQAGGMTLKEALQREYRFTARSQAQGDFLEGVRALIIDRDFAPKWQHNSYDVPQDDIDGMLASLGPSEWTDERETP